MKTEDYLVILALGDSHYCDSCEVCGVAGGSRCMTDFTKKTVSDYLDGFYDFGNAIVSVLESIENGQKFE